jgi:hypothetical protein
MGKIETAAYSPCPLTLRSTNKWKVECGLWGHWPVLTRPGLAGLRACRSMEGSALLAAFDWGDGAKNERYHGRGDCHQEC